MARVLFFHGPGRPLEVAHFDPPAPVGREVLVRVGCCTLCRSDLHTHAGRRAEPTPCVLGHEVVGRVEAAGREATVSVGERVTWSVAASCGACGLCAGGLPQKCERLFKYGHARATAERPFVGGLADYVLLVPGTAVVRVPEAVPDAVAAMASCATATAAAVLRAAGPLAGRGVLVLGAGALGVSACAMARAAGARAVEVYDPDAGRVERAGAFGAAAAPAGGEYDVVLELAGARESVEEALARARVGGVVVLAGTVRPVGAVALDPERVVRRMLTVRGVHNYHPADLEAALAYLAGPGREQPFGSLVEATFPLARADEAFTHGHARPGGRVAVVP